MMRIVLAEDISIIASFFDSIYEWIKAYVVPIFEEITTSREEVMAMKSY